MSLELRWIFDDTIPKKVKKWFYKELESIADPKEPPYEDIYLFNPEVDYSSVKFREDKLDTKWRRNSFQISVAKKNKKRISGIAEDWVHWEWKEKKTANEIQGFIGSEGSHPWIRVDKERYRIRYRMNGNGDDGISSLIPTKGESNAICSIEIVQLKLKKNKKNISWWSLGLDLFSNKKVSKHERSQMEEIVEYLLKDYPKKKALKSSNSYSYPKLFSMNVKNIR